MHSRTCVQKLLNDIEPNMVLRKIFILVEYLVSLIAEDDAGFVEHRRRNVICTQHLCIADHGLRTNSQWVGQLTAYVLFVQNMPTVPSSL